jgi:hypothetical protein
MKMYTNESQTAKLIELGFKNPNSEVECDLPKGDWRIGAVGLRKAYSIGELIEMLPKSLKNSYNPPLIIECNEKWRVYYGVQEDYSWEWSIWLEEERKELIDALYDMVVKLKEEEVI